MTFYVVVKNVSLTVWVFKMKFESNLENTDKEIWRKVKDDYYSPSIHVTENNGIGLNVGGLVIVKTIEEWHELAKREEKYYVDGGYSAKDILDTSNPPNGIPLLSGHGRCVDCDWYGVEEGCNVERDSKLCKSNKIPK